jgi:hypothetical protein
MNEGAGKRGKARQQRQQTMAIQRQMLGRIKPGKSAEPLSTGGTLAARASLRRARAKAGPGASPAQRGAVKRAGTYLKASKERNRAAVKGAASRGTVGKPKGLKQGAVTARVKSRAVKKPGMTLTKESVQNRVTRRSTNQKNYSKGIKIESAKKQSNFMETTRRRQSFADYISKKARYETSQDLVKAFKGRPRYSTRQKIKPNFNYKVSDWTGRPK